MGSTASIRIDSGSLLKTVQGLLGKFLADEEVAGIFVPRHLPAKGIVMPSLVTDAGQLEAADPIAPSFPLNGARQLARLTQGELDGSLVAVLRPCEIRAFVELVKLNQGSLDNVLLVSVDCHGAFDNQGYRAYLETVGDMRPEQSDDFLRKAAAGEIGERANGLPGFARACMACEFPTAQAADLHIGLFGMDLGKELQLISGTPRGEGMLNRLGLGEAAHSDKREQAIAQLTRKRTSYRDAMFEQTRAGTDSPAKLAQYLAGCVNCYNCRVACPVCYCKECVFVTDVFEHKPWQFLDWARQKGALRMPTDTLFYHLTRMAHMSTACVGCGQCSNACPNDIPVMEIFRLAASRTQGAFGYQAGADVGDKPPLAVFKEKEFPEVTGGLD